MGVTEAVLVLRDGRVFRGEALGATGEAAGEVIFNTAMTGYQEILTDPSYRGQIVTMTYPMIGNYGLNDEDVESRRPWVNGLIVKEASAYPSSWRGRVSLAQYLARHGIVGLQGIDTRALTRHLRDHGSQDGIIASGDGLDVEALRARARALPQIVGQDLVRHVTVDAPFGWSEGEWRRERGYVAPPPARFKVVAYDAGIKLNILRQLRTAGCEVVVVPADMPAAGVLEHAPDGLFLSNGPGDPEGVPYLIESVRGLIGKLPIFGICLGHQIIGLAAGGRTYKLPFGHHGANHPVRDLATGRVEITSQNHNFAVDPASLEQRGWEPTHLNLNDGTCEGLRHRELPVFCVQYHPEASPGPHDASYLFRRFTDLMASGWTPLTEADPRPCRST
jgi:carbamoyl-phosphate synthase small subunit